MTKVVKLSFTLVVFVGLCSGMLLGFQKTNVRLRAAGDARRSVAERELQEFSGIQYRHADYNHAKAALELYTTFLAQADRANPDSAWKLNLSIASARLASLEEKAHNSQQSRVYMDAAKSWCDAARQPDCSETELTTMRERFDENEATHEP